MNTPYRTPEDLHPYQQVGVRFLLDHPLAALFFDMGLGKTATTLTAIVHLLERLQIYGVLVLAPRRVAETVWHIEAQRWSHTRHLRIRVLRGSNKNLLARELLRPYEIFVINYEAIPWLVTQINERFLRHRRYPPFNMVVFDELTRCKNPEGMRMRTFAPLLPDFDRRVGLTGTPAPNGYWDLHGQYRVLDDGKRLGTDQQVWKEQYFIEDQYSRKRVPATGSKEKIEARIRDITLSMTDTDYLDLPEYVYNDLEVILPAKVRIEYERFEKTMFAELDHGVLEVFNAAALTNKCRQLANGNLVDSENPDKPIPVHDVKLEALDDVLEEAAGNPVLCAYIFRVDLHRIRKRYERRYKVAYLGPGVSDNQALRIVDAWNGGAYDLLLTHPLSAGHGLNLQFGGNRIVWVGLDWNLEGWLQLNARLRRQGQQARSVIVHRILAADTIDHAVKDALDHKLSDQAGLRRALENYRKRRENKLVA